MHRRHVLQAVGKGRRYKDRTVSVSIGNIVLVAVYALSEGMKQVEELVGSGTNKGGSFRSRFDLIDSLVVVRWKGFDMRGNIKLFTLSIDMRQGHRFEVAGYEKMDRSITDGISTILDQAPGLNA